MSFLFNSWYCAGWTSDLDQAPLGRKLLGRPLVFYRDSNGEVIALDGACPHRFAPLWKGQVQGDNIMCPYHGLVFGSSGTCIHNPHGDGHIPPNAKVERYPVVERDGILWIWMGDKDRADPALLPDTSWMSSPDLAVITGALDVGSNYQLVIDNLLDLTHGPYLHSATVGGTPEESANLQHEFHTDDDGVVHSNYIVPNQPRPSLQIIPFWGEHPGDFRAEMRWRPASILELDIRMSPVGGDKYEGLHQPMLHLITPISEHSAHYFYVMGRNMLIDNEEVTAATKQIVAEAFGGEDEPMIRECSTLMGGETDLFALSPAILKTDIAAVQARRMLAKLMKAEAAQTVA